MLRVGWYAEIGKVRSISGFVETPAAEALSAAELEESALARLEAPELS
jgi:hypothetical protein